MGRLTDCWTNVQTPSSYTSSDPTTGSSVYDDHVEYAVGKVYERTQKSVTPDGGSTTAIDYTVNDGYQITDVEGTTVTWDDNGQLLEDDQGWDFTWTALGQLAAADHASLADRDHVYDAFGRRVETTDGTDTWEYLYHGWHMVGEIDGTDWLWMEVPMAWGEGMLEHIAWDSSASDYKQHAVHEDFQSTVWALSNTAGTVVERYVQDDPYGVTHTLDSGSSNLGDYETEVYHRKRLHGGVVDAVVGIYDFRNRWLRPEEGTWMSRDPLGPVDSWNLIQFVGLAPYTSRDVYGLHSFENNTDERLLGLDTHADKKKGFRVEGYGIVSPEKTESIGGADIYLVCCGSNCKMYRVTMGKSTCNCVNGEPDCDDDEVTECVRHAGRGWDKRMICTLCSWGTTGAYGGTGHPAGRMPDICSKCCHLNSFEDEEDGEKWTTYTWTVKAQQSSLYPMPPQGHAPPDLVLLGGPQQQ